jgi:superfamily II DNA or RNA helicase
MKYDQTILALQTPITGLKPRQIDALYNLRESKDLVVVLPTGYGKTLIFELIPFYLQCKVVVLEPLNAILNQLCSTLDGHVIRITEHFQDHST